MARLICSLAPDNAGSHLMAVLDGSERRLDVAAYAIDRVYGERLMQLHSRGVRLRVVVDATPSINAETITELSIAGIACRVVRIPDAAAHATLLVADTDRLTLGTGELSVRDAPVPLGRTTVPGARNWWATVSEAPTLAEAARAHFGRLWTRAGAPLRLIGNDGDQEPAVELRALRTHSDELSCEVASRRMHLTTSGAGVAAAQRDLIAGARDHAWVAVTAVHPAAPRVHELLATLIGVARRGGDARLLLGVAPAPADIGTLIGLGIPVRVMDPKHCTVGNVRGVIVDDTVSISTADWTDAGLGRNDEVSLSIAEPAVAAYFADSLDSDWSSASEVAMSSLRPRQD